MKNLRPSKKLALRKRPVHHRYRKKPINKMRLKRRRTARSFTRNLSK